MTKLHHRVGLSLALLLLGITGLGTKSFASAGPDSFFAPALEKRLRRLSREQAFVARLRPWVAYRLQERHSPEDYTVPLLAVMDPVDKEPPTLGMELCRARVYWLLGMDLKAIEVLKCVVGDHGEEEAPDLQIQAALMAKLWMGTLHRWGGRRNEAISVYQEIVGGKWSRQIEEFVLPACRLYLNGLLSESSGRVIQRSASADRDVSGEVFGKSGDLSRKFYVELGQTVGAPTPSGQGKGRREDLEKGFRPGSLDLLMIHHLMLIGVHSDPIAGFEGIPGVQEEFLEMARRSGDSVDRELASHLLGRVAVAREDWAKAESIYRELFTDGSLRLPQSGLSLARCQALGGNPESAASTLSEVAQSFPNRAFEVFKVRRQILP